MFTNRLYVIFILILSSFSLADVPTPPPVIAQYPALDAHHPNKIAGGGNYTMTNGRVTITIPPSSPRPFGGVSSSGGNMVGGYPANATVNNGYGNQGSINTQAASTYGKQSKIGAASNKLVGMASGLYLIGSYVDLLNYTYEDPDGLVKCFMLHDCSDVSKKPLPPDAPQSVWEELPGAYDPEAKSVTVFLDNNNQPALSVYGLSLGSGAKNVLPDQPWVVNGINVVPYGSVSGGFIWVAFDTYTDAASLAKYADISIDKVRSDDFRYPLTEEDLYNALIYGLEKMPNEVATAIMNALHDGGVLGAPDSTVFDPASYTSPPYTAADTGIAQQDKFTLNQDGSISHQVVARPDLQGNNQLAPEKQPSTNPTDPTNPTEPEKPKEPEEEVIPPIDDVAIPVEETPIAFTPDNTFQNDGVCPAPTVLNVMGASFDISYEPFCYFAEKIRPVLILMAAFSSLYFCLSVAFKG